MRDQKLIIADGHHRYETAWPIATSGKLRRNGSGLPVPYDS